MKQNPDIALARIDAEKARQAIRVAKDPFAPRLTVGSGLAYSNGFPLSIEGSAPSIVQAQAAQYLFNRPQSYAVAQAKENARGASLGVAGKRDEVGYRIASLFLDAERAARVGDLADKDADSQQKVLDAVTAQVEEGRALPLAQKTAPTSWRSRGSWPTISPPTVKPPKRRLRSPSVSPPRIAWFPLRIRALRRLCPAPRRRRSRPPCRPIWTCAASNRRSPPNNWSCGAPVPPACRASISWPNTACLPSSTTTGLLPLFPEE